MPNTDFKVNYNGVMLKQLLKIFKSAPKARVGVLGATTGRKSEGMSFEEVKALEKRFKAEDVQTNASIGAKHEFGEDGLPVRSWLRMPLATKMQKYLDKADSFTPDVAKEVLKGGSMAPWVAKLGILAESVIKDAFATGGFGQWKPSNMEYKKNHQTLVETQQLRDSIISEVVDAKST